MPNIEVSLGLTAADTAQRLRASINAFSVSCTAAGDGATLTVSARDPGPDGAGIALSASGAEPAASHANLQAGSLIKTLIGGLVSDFRGVLSMFFDGMISANNPYPKPWKTRVRRTTAGWHGGTAWYSSKATVSLSSGAVKAMNPAHILYQCITDPVWGLAQPADRLYEPSFYSAANVLYDEGFGLCMAWNKQEPIRSFIASVVNHIGAALYVDRETGLWTLRLIRGDYDPETLPVFDYESGLLAVEEDDAVAAEAGHNEVAVSWVDPTTGQARSSRVQSLAAIQSHGAVVSLTVDYPGLPTADLAARVAQRVLAEQTNGIRRLKVTLDRRGRQITPGSVFRISAPGRGISDMVLRAASVDEGPPTKPQIVVAGVQDVFGLPTTAYVADEPSTWEPPDTGATAAGTRRWRELDYPSLVRLLSPGDLAATPADVGFIAIVAKQPTPLSLDYVLATAASGEDYVERSAFPWCPTGRLAHDIGAYTTAVQLQAGWVGLESVGATGGAAWIGPETVRVDSYDPLTGALTISRGVADSVPVSHAAGTRVWFPGSFTAVDRREYEIGEAVTIKLLTRSSGERLSLASAPTDTVNIIGRQGLPYPPGNVRVNGEPFANGVEAVGEVVLTWAHRDRLTQSDVLVPHGDASVGPEAGTTYNIRIYDSGDNLIRSATGVSGTTWTYTFAMQEADGPYSPLIFELESVRSGSTSAQRYRWSTPHAGIGYGFNFGEYYGGEE